MATRRKGSAGSSTHQKMDRPAKPKVQLRAFNCNNFNIRFGAGITAAAGTRLALQLFLVKVFTLYSFQLQDPKGPCIVIYCHYLPVSGLGNLRACCLPGCGSRFSGSLSESNPYSPLPVETMVGHYPTIES